MQHILQQIVSKDRALSSSAIAAVEALNSAFRQNYSYFADMGANVATSWQQVVKLLQDCSTRPTDSAEAQAALQSVHKITCKLEKLDTPPKAVWKKLVQQLQVWCAVHRTWHLLLQR